MIVIIGKYTRMEMMIDEISHAEILSVIKIGTNIRPVRARDRYYAEFTHKTKKKWLVHKWILRDENPLIVDHEDGNSLNNTRVNLRSSDYSRNMINRRSFAGYKTSTALHHISFYPKQQSYRVRIVKDGKEYSRCGFKSVEAAIEYHKELLPKLFPQDFTTIFKENGYA